jgi:2-polyprenyl-3-methyl-5-hydroxy-6-metoxy-1,4-benzoquinol methylase
MALTVAAVDDSSSSVCPICAGPGAAALDAWDRNRGVSGERFVYHLCASCGTLFLPEAPSDLERYYRGGYYPFDSNGEPLWRSNPLRRRAESFRVQLLRAHVQGGSLIDIGAGSGGFVAAAHGGGFDVTAIEMDSQCCAYVEKELGVATICSDRPLQALSSLDSARAITLWHVFEHLDNPVAVLELAIEKLEHGGVLAIAVPNPRSLQFRTMRARWAHLDAPRHLLLVPPDTLIQKANSLGMRCVEMTTTDPDGLECNLFGWLNAVRPRPASGPPSKLAQFAAFALRRLFAPLERRGMNGAAVTFVFQKDAVA